MTEQLPKIALSVRQPWAWAIIHAGKDIENRSWLSITRYLTTRGRIAIHASKGMTQEDYRAGRDFIDCITMARDVWCPNAKDLPRGGIVGSVEIVDGVRDSASPWFIRQRGGGGLVLREPRQCEFIPASGQLGIFRWERGTAEDVAPPAAWMLKQPPVLAPEIPELPHPDQLDLVDLLKQGAL
jgi:hypothetical protein